MIESLVGSSLLDSEEISIFLDHTDDVLISFIVAAVAAFDRADIFECSTDGAYIDIFVDIYQLF